MTFSARWRKFTHLRTRGTCAHIGTSLFVAQCLHRSDLPPLFGVSTIDCLSGGPELGHYSPARFNVVRKSIVLEPSLVNRVVLGFANRYPDRYETRLTWIFPAWFLSFELKVVK